MAMATVITIVMAIIALISPIHSRLVAAPMNFWRDACQMKAALAKCTTLVVQYHLLHHSDQLINHLISHLINHHSDQLISHLINHHSNQLMYQLKKKITPTYKPSHKPSFKPTFKPTHKPSFKPTHKPTRKPTHKQ